jgi:hypothetical protein
MPKELIHFAIARRTAARLAGSSFAPALDARRHGLLLGAVLHDALFYATPPGGAPLEQLSHRLHGANGEDTFALIRLMADHAAERPGDPLPKALLVGAVSHLYADVTMHPLIWHLSGDYYSADAPARSLARQRHRCLEALMDMVACPEMIGRASLSLRLMLRRCPALTDTGLPMTGLAAMAGVTTQAASAALHRAWRTFAWFQAACASPGPARLAHALRPWLPRPAAELTALAYAPQLLRQADRLSGMIAYRHPVTGASCTHSLDELMNQAADKAAALCRELEPAVFNHALPALETTGPSMDAGLAGVPTGAMLHFASPPFPALSEPTVLMEALRSPRK